LSPCGDREAEQDVLAGLVRQALAGDADAFRRLVEMRQELVFRVAYHQLGSADDARTVAQAVFVRLWRSLDRYDPARRFDTWLHQVTVNAAIDHHRRRKARPVHETFAEAFHAPVARPDDPVEAREVATILAELVELLPEKQRASFVLREIEGLSSAEVAEALGTTESTVRNHVLQARRTLRRELVARHPEYAGRAGRAGSEDEPS
jgi:RNA polymerase sigma-70 factor (ECF subfamily)